MEANKNIQQLHGECLYMAWKHKTVEKNRVNQPRRVTKEGCTEEERLEGTERSQFYKE